MFFLTLNQQNELKAQQFSLYHTGTLFDSFENPSQRAFTADSSRKYALNLFIPSGGVDCAMTGPVVNTLKTAVYNDVFSSKDLAVRESRLSRITLSENIYLLMLKIFYSVNSHRELGFSWQVKTEGEGSTTNPAIILFDKYSDILKYPEAKSNPNLFNTIAQAQSYHQFSFTYRKNSGKRLSYGVKLSYLSGIAHSKLRVDSGGLDEDLQGSYTARVKGAFRTSFLYDDIHKKALAPSFKNPGLALGFSLSYQAPRGWFMRANLKDAGFIHWNRRSYSYDGNLYSLPVRYNSNEIWNDIKTRLTEQDYFTTTNSKIEFLINKDLGYYQPHLLLSKELLHSGGNIALINRVQYKSIQLSVSGAYNLRHFFQWGTQMLIKSPNTEFFIGTDQLLKSYATAHSLIRNQTSGTGGAGASAYIGFSVKIGRIMSRHENENYIPGINQKTSRSRGGLTQRIFGRKDY